MMATTELDNQIKLLNIILRLSERIDRLESRIDRRLDQIDGPFEKSYARPDQIESAIADIRECLQSLASRGVDFNFSSNPTAPQSD